MSDFCKKVKTIFRGAQRTEQGRAWVNMIHQLPQVGIKVAGESPAMPEALNASIHLARRLFSRNLSSHANKKDEGNLTSGSPLRLDVGASHFLAERIADAFGSFGKLMESYCKAGTEDTSAASVRAGEKALLKDLQVSERRSVGPAVSAKCFDFFTATDENATI